MSRQRHRRALAMANVSVTARTFFASNQEVLFSLNVMMPLVLSLWGSSFKMPELEEVRESADGRAPNEGSFALQEQTIQVALCVTFPFSIPITRYDDSLMGDYDKRRETERLAEEEFVKSLIEQEADALDPEDEPESPDDYGAESDGFPKVRKRSRSIDKTPR